MIYSKQRELVLKTLKGSASHPTADELYAMIRQSEPSISLATVYRNLNQLADYGVIQRIFMTSGADRFDAIATQHVHMVCEKCGAVHDVPEARMPDLCGIVTEQTGMVISSYSLIFHGTCPACRMKRTRAASSN